jgi:Ca2+:H+ antiporter
MPRWFYYLLVMAVIAPLIELIWGPKQETAIFIFSALALIPLAALISRATEDLEYHVGPIAGGLLNATFGNAPEIIIGIFALQHGLITVVKASLTGSIISNSLLVLGSSLAVGGWRWGKQYFSARDAGQYSTMMVLAVAGLLIPSTSSLVVQDAGGIQSLSNAIAVIMLLVYAMYLALHVFHVRSERRQRGREKPTTRIAPAEEPQNSQTSEVELPEVEAGNIEGQKPPKLWLAGLLLLIATIGTAVNSELLVGTIKPITEQFGWSQVFIGLVIIPIVGNASEHSSALFIALRDHVDLSMAISAGSSIQVATFVAPALVLVSLFFPTHLNLVFQPLELAILGLATILFPLVSLDGESTWLEGVQLLAVYLMACVVFFFVH